LYRGFFCRGFLLFSAASCGIKAHAYYQDKEASVKIFMACLIVSLLTAVTICAGDKQPAPPKDPAVKAPDNVVPNKVLKKTEPGTLSDEEVQKLQKEWTDEKSGAKYRFAATFGVTPVTPEERKKYLKNGLCPFRITGELSSVKVVDGKEVTKRESGTILMYVLDSNGKVIVKKSQAADKMCTS
jgi:hypothetical protein